MENNDSGITKEEIRDSYKTTIILLENALKEDDKELRNRISNYVEILKEINIEELFK